MMQLALVSEKASYAQLEKHADLLEKELEKVYGVKKVELIACPEREIRISLDMEKMAAMNISTDQVANAIISNNANIPGGSIKLDDKIFGLKTSGSYGELSEIKRTVVNSYLGKIIYLEDIASVEFDYEDLKYLARFPMKTENGELKGESSFRSIPQPRSLAWPMRLD